MSKSKKTTSEGDVHGLGGVLGGLAHFLEQLGELAEKGEELHQAGELRGAGDRLRGVYGFHVKVGLGKDRGIKVEPFGDVRPHAPAGGPVVSEVREPLADVFDEDDHVLVVVELPGVGEDEVTLELHDDILTVSAAHGDLKYQKEILLPASFRAEQLTRTCRNGVLEVRLGK